MSDVRDLYAKLGITLLRTTGLEAPARCFASPDTHRHDDRHPSASVNLNSGAWICHGCGARGGPYDAALLRGHTPRSAMNLLITHQLAEPRETTKARRSRTATPVAAARLKKVSKTELTVTEEQITTWARRLGRETDLIARLETERVIDPQTLDRFQIGHDGQRITIPLRDQNGRIVGVLRWLPFSRGSAPKMLALPGTRRELFPAPEHTPGPSLALCEGEPDALAAHTAGLTAIAIPGVNGWRTEWASRFAGREVTIVLDCDREGRACAQRIAKDLADHGVAASVIDLATERKDGYDLTDHLRIGKTTDQRAATDVCFPREATAARPTPTSPADP